MKFGMSKFLLMLIVFCFLFELVGLIDRINLLCIVMLFSVLFCSSVFVKSLFLEVMGIDFVFIMIGLMLWYGVD